MLTAPLSAPPVDYYFDDEYEDDDWVAPTKAHVYRSASVGNSWGVTSIGRGFNWKKKEAHDATRQEALWDQSEDLAKPESDRHLLCNYAAESARSVHPSPSMATVAPSASKSIPILCSNVVSAEPLSLSPTHSPSSSRPLTPISIASSQGSGSHTVSRSPSFRSLHPRPRRRSSQQRVSLIAGRVSIAVVEPPDPPPLLPAKLIRTGSNASLLSLASSAGAPPSDLEPSGFLSERSISEFVIEKEIGRGAYGLVKRAKEMQLDGSLGPPVIIKQVIKSRILADCWKRHPKFGTIPIEIYVLSSISSTSYVLPTRRPWDPSRPAVGPRQDSTDGNDYWIVGKEVKGHPNICSILDFFEDVNYYYLVMPSCTREPSEQDPSPPSDLFDLVERYPNGLPPSDIRTYLGQIADALCFLHSKGIVHRDIKDENVIIGPGGRCLLIDFGSSGLIRKGGWDTFSGTLDYAGPEILRGERYEGKEQDVWAFGVVAYVMLVGECPFTTAAEAQDGLESPFANATMALDERCADGKEQEGLESDGGGALGDAAALVRVCLNVDLSGRPTFEKILESRFLSGKGGWGVD